jgi:hypothetical protein
VVHGHVDLEAAYRLPRDVGESRLVVITIAVVVVIFVVVARLRLPRQLGRPWPQLHLQRLR